MTWGAKETEFQFVRVQDLLLGAFQAPHTSPLRVTHEPKRRGVCVCGVWALWGVMDVCVCVTCGVACWGASLLYRPCTAHRVESPSLQPFNDHNTSTDCVAAVGFESYYQILLSTARKRPSPQFNSKLLNTSPPFSATNNRLQPNSSSGSTLLPCVGDASDALGEGGVRAKESMRCK